ncbi:MAG: rhodanese-like domain-containing protein [Myxococcota bacterium]
MSLFEHVFLSPLGVDEVTAESLHRFGQGVRIVDVRQPEEWIGELGHIAGSELLPLAEFMEAASTWDKSAPLALVCRSGARSGQATVTLKNAGFEHVVNLQGGMIAWNAAGYEVER